MINRENHIHSFRYDGEHVLWDSAKEGPKGHETCPKRVHRGSAFCTGIERETDRNVALLTSTRNGKGKKNSEKLSEPSRRSQNGFNQTPDVIAIVETK